MPHTLRNKKKDAQASCAQILKAATVEFARAGFDGARMDNIAELAGLNKQLIYYYYQSKDHLFSECLFALYKKLRECELSIDVKNLSAREALIKLIENTFEFYDKNPELAFLLGSENLRKAVHLKERPRDFIKLNQSWADVTERILKKAKIDGTLRYDVDVLQVNISLAALIFFYITNNHTLSVLSGINLSSPLAKKDRLQSVKDTMLGWLAPNDN